MASRHTAAKRKLFLQAYVDCGAITSAAKAADVSETLHYVWLKDPAYAEAFAEAERLAVNRMEAELVRRVYEGTEEPVVYQGELCYQKDAKGKLTNKPLTIKRKSDTLLIFALKGKRPEVYRDNFRGEILHTADIRVSHKLQLQSLTDENLEQLEAMFRLDSGDPSESDL